MDGLSIFALLILGVLIISAIMVFVIVARLPGEIARRRNHPQAEAVAVGGWLGLLFGGVLWPLVMIWAFLKPQDQKRPDTGTDASGYTGGKIQS